MKRVIALALTLCFVGAMILGSGPSIGLSPRIDGRTGLANDIGSASAGGIASDFDTVTVMFTFAPDVPTNAHTEFSAFHGAADLVVDLSQSENKFAFCMVDSANPNAVVNTVDANAWIRTTIRSSAAVGDNWRLDSASRVNELFYIPFEDHIPLDSQIVYAIVKRIAASTAVVAASDSLCSTLMTVASDNLWRSSVGTTNPSVGQTRYAHATWRHQISGLNVDGYPVSNGGAWVPKLGDRTRFWDYGDYSDWSGRPSGSTTVQFTEWEQIITNCVQAAVNGKVNNGIISTYADESNAVETWRNYSWEATGAGVPYRPWVAVKYITRRYRAPFPDDKDWAMVVSTDDGRYKLNVMVSDTIAAHNGRVTIGITASTTNPANDATWLKIADINSFIATGNIEIATHSVSHVGLPTFPEAKVGDLIEYTVGMYPSTLTGSATDWDEVMYAVDPYFILYQLEDGGYGDFSGNQMVARSYLISTGGYSPAAQVALSRHNYRGVRVLQVDRQALDSDGNRDSIQVAEFRPGAADTMYGGLRPNHMNRPRPIIMFGNQNDVVDFVGGKTDFYSDAVINYRVRNAIETVRAQGTRVISFLLHDVKTSSDSDYSTGNIDANEFGLLCAMTNTLNGAWMTVGDLGAWWLRNSTPIATPTAYAQPDSFKFTPSERVWGRLNGMDGAFIPGLVDASIAEDASPPREPFNVTAAEGNTLILIDWDDSTAPDIDHYVVSRSTTAGGPYLPVNSDSPSFYENTGLSNGTEYFYIVEAYDSTGNKSDASAEVSAIPSL